MGKTGWQYSGSAEEKARRTVQTPRIISAALSKMPDCYKIKLRQAGYRLVYRVDDDIAFVTVIAIGKRDKQRVYETVRSRLYKAQQ